MLTYRCGNSTIEGTPEEVAQFFLLTTAEAVPAPAPAVSHVFSAHETKAVAKAVRQLDEIKPGWAESEAFADLSKFNQADPGSCVLKRVFGDYIHGDGVMLRHFGELRYGSVNPWSPDSGCCKNVTELFRRAIVDRRAGL